MDAFAGRSSKWEQIGWHKLLVTPWNYTAIMHLAKRALIIINQALTASTLAMRLTAKPCVTEKRGPMAGIYPVEVALTYVLNATVSQKNNILKKAKNPQVSLTRL